MLFKYEFDDINIKHMIDETPHEVSSFFYNHTHENEYELLFFIQGSARLMLDNSLYSLYPNTLVIIKPGLEHQVIVAVQPSAVRAVKPVVPYYAERLVTVALYETGVAAAQHSRVVRAD